MTRLLRSSGRAEALLIGVLALVPASPAIAQSPDQAGAAAANLVVEVTADQRVTITGRSSSLRAVVEDICYRAGIDLLSWDADDSPFGGTYQDVAAADLFGRLLRRHSFLLETVSAADMQRITALRVLGDPAVAAARRARGIGGRRSAKFEVPPTLLDTAFAAGSGDAAGQQTALATLAARISGDPAQLQGFLATDARLIAQAIERYRGVEEPLRELQRRHPDPRIAVKIDEIIAALGTLRTAAGKK